MHNRLTWDSGCWIVREQIPESASQNLLGLLDGVLYWHLFGEPDSMIVASCNRI